MSLTAYVPVCPPGFDCAFLNSCPHFYVPCPDGYFCGSYEGYPDQSEMDFRYASYKYMNSATDVTHQNKIEFIDPDRAIQVKCLFGFFCSSSSQMEVRISRRSICLNCV